MISSSGPDKNLLFSMKEPNEEDAVDSLLMRLYLKHFL